METLSNTIDIPRMAEDAFLRGWSYRRWAEKAGVAHVTVQRFVKRKHFTPDTLDKLSRALGRTPRYYKSAHKNSVPRRATRLPLNSLRCPR